MAGPQRRLRVAVLMGGRSSEHDVSITSGLQVLGSLDASRYEAIPVEIRRDGAWQIGGTPEARSLEREVKGSGTFTEDEPPAALITSVSSVKVPDPFTSSGIDVVFVALHGAGGEDGTVQGLLTLLGLPYTGSGVLASALAMDKVKAKEIYALHGIPTARQVVVTRRDVSPQARAATLSRIESEVGLPCVVKPVVGGSSVATHVVASAADLPSALEDALAADERALVEERLEGVEVTCAVLGGGPHEEATPLPVTEIVPKAGFFDFRAKYTPGASEEITPARIDEGLTRRVQELAVRAHEALGCEGMSRTDFIIRGEPVALETNTIPGLTPMSLLPQAAAAAGIPFPRLLDRLIDSALLRASKTAR